MGYTDNIVQVPPGIPDGLEVGVYRLQEVEHDRRVGRKPSATPIATGTVSAAGKVTLPRLPDDDYALHATVGSEERYGVFARGLNWGHESARNRRRRIEYGIGHESARNRRRREAYGTVR